MADSLRCIVLYALDEGVDEPGCLRRPNRLPTLADRSEPEQ